MEAYFRNRKKIKKKTIKIGSQVSWPGLELTV